MLHATTLMLALLCGQKPATTPPPETDEEIVAGHPEGDVPALPSQVVWDLKKAPIEKNAKRQRISLAGTWRFAAVHTRDAKVLRTEMGFVEMPGPADRQQWKISDKNFKPTDGKWAGKPAASYPWLWCERFIEAPLSWTNYQVFLVVRGPWSAAEVYCGYLPIEPIERDGGRYYEITEALTYGGDATLALRLAAEKAEAIKSDAAPYIGIELMPVLPRYDRITVRSDSAKQELELTIDLRRPRFFLGLPVRLPDLPLVVKLTLEDVESGQAVVNSRQEIGPMPKELRTVTVRIPWSAEKGKSPPANARLRAELTSTHGGDFDAIFPLEFAPGKLPAVETR